MRREPSAHALERDGQHVAADEAARRLALSPRPAATRAPPSTKHLADEEVRRVEQPHHDAAGQRRPAAAPARAAPAKRRGEAAATAAPHGAAAGAAGWSPRRRRGPRSPPVPFRGPRCPAPPRSLSPRSAFAAASELGRACRRRPRPSVSSRSPGLQRLGERRRQLRASRGQKRTLRCPRGARRLHHQLAADAGDGLLACRVDVRHPGDVGAEQRAPELGLRAAACASTGAAGTPLTTRAAGERLPRRLPAWPRPPPDGARSRPPRRRRSKLPSRSKRRWTPVNAAISARDLGEGRARRASATAYGSERVLHVVLGRAGAA